MTALFTGRLHVPLKGLHACSNQAPPTTNGDPSYHPSLKYDWEWQVDTNWCKKKTQQYFWKCRNIPGDTIHGSEILQTFLKNKYCLVLQTSRHLQKVMSNTGFLTHLTTSSIFQKFSLEKIDDMKTRNEALLKHLKSILDSYTKVRKVQRHPRFF